MYQYPHRNYTPAEVLESEAVTDWGESLVVDDTAIPLRELVEKYTTGELLRYRGDDSGYEDDVDIDDVPESDTIDYSKLDLAELTSLRQYLDARINKLQGEADASAEEAVPSAPSEGHGGEQPPTKENTTAV